MEVCKFCGKNLKYTGKKDWAGRIYICVNKNCISNGGNVYGDL